MQSGERTQASGLLCHATRGIPNALHAHDHLRIWSLDSQLHTRTKVREAPKDSFASLVEPNEDAHVLFAWLPAESTMHVLVRSWADELRPLPRRVISNRRAAFAHGLEEHGCERQGHWLLHASEGTPPIVRPIITDSALIRRSMMKCRRNFLTRQIRQKIAPCSESRNHAALLHPMSVSYQKRGIRSNTKLKRF
jgi:hypothetical protein